MLAGQSRIGGSPGVNAIPTWILANLSESDKWQKQIRDIVESAYDHGADMIVTPCQLCQANVEVYQSEINKKQDTKFALPVIYYSQLLSVVYGASVEQSGLDGHVTQPKKLQDIAGINDGAIIHTLGTVT